MQDILSSRKHESSNTRIVFATAIVLCAGIMVGEEPTKAFKVSGVGGYPIDESTTSMWLLAPSGQPVVMAYFHGPTGWHNRKWKIDSKFEKGSPGWAKFISEAATLSLSADMESGKLEVQGKLFNEADANTFLVVHVGEKESKEEVIALGSYEQQKTKNEPAALELLRANPELLDRIKKAISSAANR